MALDPRLFEVLVCPACRNPVEPRDGETCLRCTGCGRRYPVRDGIPVMLVAEADAPDEPASSS